MYPLHNLQPGKGKFQPSLTLVLHNGAEKPWPGDLFSSEGRPIILPSTQEQPGPLQLLIDSLMAQKPYSTPHPLASHLEVEKTLSWVLQCFY